MNHSKTFLLLTVSMLLVTCNALAQLKAGFVPDKPGGCSPVAITFINATTGASANAVYSWDFGNGNSAATSNAGALYEDEKTYTVTLTVTDGAQTSVKTQNITVYNKPLINDITASPLKGCLPLNAAFTANANAGSGSISSYFWDFGDGSTQQGYSSVQQHLYTIQQKATLSVTVTNSFGCSNSLQKKDLVEIIPAINASFNASQTILCRETDAVQFNNTSYGPGTLSYQWDFGDGTGSTVAAPAHSFNKKGIYTVKLTTTSSEGCVVSNTQAGYINVASFSSDFSYQAPVCKGSYITFNSTSTPYNYASTWEVDGFPVYYYAGYMNYTFNTAGNHIVKLKNIFGTCPDSVSKTISVKDIPYPNGFADTILGTCGAPVAMQFKDTTAGAVQWQWNFTNYYSNPDAVTQSGLYNYGSDGNYYATLKVTNADGCSAVTGKYIGITRPYVYITATGNSGGCGPVTKTFTANSADPLTAWNWNFGDGNTSASQQPQHMFSNPGTYGVTLSYITSKGCSGTVSYGTVTVYTKPSAEFTGPATVCGNTAAVFSAVQQLSDNSYYWKFGDVLNGGYNYGYQWGVASHQYDYDSSYTVSLVVINPGGCTDTVVKKDFIKVLPPFPKIAAIANTCADTRGLVIFTQTSKKGETFNWDFGDGTTAYLVNDQPSINHTYTKTGTYNISLTVTNGQCSLKENSVVRVLLKQKPVFGLSRTDICAGETFGFTLNNIETNPLQSSYYDSYNYVKWQYSDGTDFNGTHSGYNYNSPWYSNTFGTAVSYSNVPSSIRVIFQSAGFGCQDTSNFVPVKFKGALAGFEIIADKQCWRDPVVLRDTSKVSGSSSISNLAWNFGDGTTQNLKQGGLVSHRYASPGGYSVTLTITDAAGCTNTTNVTRYVEVNGPKAFFSASAYSTTITLPVYFYNNTNNYNSYNTEYQWQFGDGSTSTDYYPSHAYAVPGNYTVRLIALNPLTLCRDTAYQSIKVLNFNPAFSFTSSNVSGKCPPVVARFSNTSYNYTRIAWDFGDGATADNVNYPSHVYEKPGKYIVTLFVFGPSGLKATYIDSVIVKQPAALLQTDTTELCINGSAELRADLLDSQKNYLWDFGDGSLANSTDSFMLHSYRTAGIFRPALMTSDVNGCAAIARLTQTINVHPNPTVNFSPSQPVVCKGGRLQLNASGGTVYEWSPVTGLDNPISASPMASPDVNTLYTVFVKDALGCSNKKDLNVIVAQPFTLHAPADETICYGKSILLQVTGADTYKWINNIAGLNSTRSANPVATPVQTTLYTVTGEDKYHCFADTAGINITVAALPLVNAGADQEVQLAAPVALPVATDNDIVKWNWSPSTYLSCSNCAAPVSTPMGTTTYTVAVTNSKGCIATDTVLIKVHCEDNSARIPNAFTPNSDGHNDLFMIKGVSLVKHLLIYDRWGEKVFERTNFIAADRSSCWDGTYKGNPASTGSYVYYVEMQCPSGGLVLLKGSVVLIR